MFTRFLLRWALPAVVFVIAAGCATTSQGNATVREARPQEIAARVQGEGWTKSDVHRASELYALKCGRCHKFYDPAEYDAEEWSLWIKKMSRKAKLEPAQQEVLMRYLAAARARK